MPENPENKYKKWIKFFLPFFHLSSNPSDALKSGISNFSAKKNPFSFIIYPSIGIFWLLCKTNHSNRAWPTFLYWQPRNFLVLGALSSSAFFFVFNPSWNGVFRHTKFIDCLFIFVTPFSMCDRMSHFSLEVFVFSLLLTDIFVLTTLRTRNNFFSFTVETFVLIQIRIYSGTRNEIRICKCSR